MRIAFSGSGLLFPMHLGAYHALSQYDQSELTELSGTSGGSVVAAALAFFDDDSVYDIAHSLNLENAVEYNPTAIFSKGYCYGRSIEADLKTVFGDRTFRDTQVPLHITASDVATGKPFVFNANNTPNMLVRDAIRASLAVPFLYTPVHYDNMLLVDGGVFDSTPVRQFARSGMEHTYGIRLMGTTNLPGYKWLGGYFVRIISMLASAVDQTYVDLGKLDINTDMFFLKTDRYNFGVYDVESLILEGEKLMKAKLESFQTQLALLPNQ